MKTLTTLSRATFIVALFIGLNIQSNAQIIEKIDSLISYEFDTTNMSYTQDYRVILEFDSANNNLYHMSYEWDMNTSSWIPEDSAGYIYNSQGQRTQEYYGEWDPLTSSFPTTDRRDYYYDANGNLTAAYSFDYDTTTTSWDSSYQELNTYDANQNLILNEEYFWNSSAMEWEGDEKDTFIYNANNDLIEQLEYRWDNMISNWESQARSKRENLYNSSNGYLDTTYYYNWNSLNAQFESTFRSLYTNDALGNPLTNSDQNFINSVWTTTEDALYQYDTLTNINQLALPIDYVLDYWAQQVSKRTYRIGYQYDYSNQVLYLDDSTHYYFSPVNPTSLNEEQYDNLISFYPNPSNDILNISLKEGSEIRIFDFSGKEVVQRQRLNQGLNTLNLSKLSGGIYFIQFENGGQQFSKKFIKSE